MHASPAPFSTKSSRQYPCLHCNKVFSRPSSLQSHVYTHTGEKPYRCTAPGCSKGFAVPSNLRRHQRVHQKPSVNVRCTPEQRVKQVQALMMKHEQQQQLDHVSDLATPPPTPSKAQQHQQHQQQDQHSLSHPHPL
ncbi:hypothetical protein BC940DRAFT_239426 [Gongronella butleri]|nr:hypothetical protein BC940DRAFT_239426 [Gongronella butleri]